jgi:hypothetical protein
VKIYVKTYPINSLVFVVPVKTSPTESPFMQAYKANIAFGTLSK